MSLLAKKLGLLERVSIQIAFVRKKSTPCSVSPLQSQDLPAADLQRLTSPESALANSAELTLAESALARNKDLMATGINTCEKNCGAPVFGRPPCLSRRPASTIFLRRKPRESGDPIRIAVPSDPRKREILWNCRRSTAIRFPRGRVRPKCCLKKGN